MSVNIVKMNTFQSLTFCLLASFAETLPLLSGEDESGEDGTIYATYPVAPCSLEKSISELKALSNVLCDEDDTTNNNIDYWLAMCSCTMNKSFPCPHCSVSGGRTMPPSENEDHLTTTPISGRSTTAKPILSTVVHWSGNLNLNQETHEHGGFVPHKGSLLLSPPVKRGGNHTSSHNFIRFG